MIKCQSAGHLHYDRMYDDIEIAEFRSVYDPRDYEDVPRVMNHKIAKYIERGRFRKGKKITME